MTPVSTRSRGQGQKRGRSYANKDYHGSRRVVDLVHSVEGADDSGDGDASLSESDIPEDWMHEIYGLDSKCNGNCRDNKSENPLCLCKLATGQRRRGIWLKCPDSIRTIQGSKVLTRLRGENQLSGLRNLGATCYINVLLQALFMNASFREAVYRARASENGQNFEAVHRLQTLFANLEFGSAGCYDPTPLTETIKIATGVQQDAQEFNKLFLAFLDEKLKSLRQEGVSDIIPKLWRGTLSYVTKCSSCGRCSESSSARHEFHELQLSVANFASIGQAIADFVRPERLTGANKYYCEWCREKQNASRRIWLQELPRFLNFQLLRAAYDKRTQRLKKVLTPVAIPFELDMQEFVKSDPSQSKDKRPKEVFKYELSAVLMHKGASASAGHYAARIRDATGQWHMFDDESVYMFEDKDDLVNDDGTSCSSIEALGGQRSDFGQVGKTADDSDDEFKLNRPTGKRPAKRRRRSAGGAKAALPPAGQTVPAIAETAAAPKRKVAGQDGASCRGAVSGPCIVSQDAYMLVYEKKGDGAVTLAPLNDSKERRIGALPADIFSEVSRQNAQLKSEFETHDERLAQGWESIRASREDVERSIELMETCGTDVDDDCCFVSVSNLKDWLAFGGQGADNKLGVRLCPHGKVDPDGIHEVKVISSSAAKYIASRGDTCPFIPVGTTLCEECARSSLGEERKLQDESEARALIRSSLQEAKNSRPMRFNVSKAWLNSFLKGEEVDVNVDANSALQCRHQGIFFRPDDCRQLTKKGWEAVLTICPGTTRIAGANIKMCVLCGEQGEIVDRKKAEEAEFRRNERRDLRFLVGPPSFRGSAVFKPGFSKKMASKGSEKEAVQGVLGQPRIVEEPVSRPAPRRVPAAVRSEPLEGAGGTAVEMPGRAVQVGVAEEDGATAKPTVCGENAAVSRVGEAKDGAIIPESAVSSGPAVKDQKAVSSETVVEAEESVSTKQAAKPEESGSSHMTVEHGNTVVEAEKSVSTKPAATTKETGSSETAFNDEKTALSDAVGAADVYVSKEPPAEPGESVPSDTAVSHENTALSDAVSAAGELVSKEPSAKSEEPQPSDTAILAREATLGGTDVSAGPSGSSAAAPEAPAVSRAENPSSKPVVTAAAKASVQVEADSTATSGAAAPAVPGGTYGEIFYLCDSKFSDNWAIYSSPGSKVALRPEAPARADLLCKHGLLQVDPVDCFKEELRGYRGPGNGVVRFLTSDEYTRLLQRYPTKDVLPRMEIIRFRTAGKVLDFDGFVEWDGFVEGKRIRLLVATEPKVCRVCVAEQKKKQLEASLSYTHGVLSIVREPYGRLAMMRGKAEQSDPTQVVRASDSDTSDCVTMRSSTRTRNGVMQVVMSSSDPVMQLKLKIMERLNFLPSTQVLLYDGRVLEVDDLSLMQERIPNGATISLFVNDQVSDVVYDFSDGEDGGFEGTELISTR